jgi:hypothetical protein
MVLRAISWHPVRQVYHFSFTRDLLSLVSYILLAASSFLGPFFLILQDISDRYSANFFLVASLAEQHNMITLRAQRHQLLHSSMFLQ